MLFFWDVIWCRLLVSRGLVYTMLESWNHLKNKTHSIYKALQTIKYTVNCYCSLDILGVGTHH